MSDLFGGAKIHITKMAEYFQAPEPPHWSLFPQAKAEVSWDSVQGRHMVAIRILAKAFLWTGAESQKHLLVCDSKQSAVTHRYGLGSLTQSITWKRENVYKQREVTAGKPLHR